MFLFSLAIYHVSLGIAIPPSLDPITCYLGLQPLLVAFGVANTPLPNPRNEDRGPAPCPSQLSTRDRGPTPQLRKGPQPCGEPDTPTAVAWD